MVQQGLLIRGSGVCGRSAVRVRTRPRDEWSVLLCIMFKFGRAALSENGVRQNEDEYFDDF